MGEDSAKNSNQNPLPLRGEDGRGLLLDRYLSEAEASGAILRDWLGRDTRVSSSRVCDIATRELGLGANAIIAIRLSPCFTSADDEKLARVKEDFGEVAYNILVNYIKIRELYQNTSVIRDENFRDLLMSLCTDIRVILIVIAETVAFLRYAGELETLPVAVIQDAALLYAPLAHKLGLYKLKSEIEDLSLKYLEPEAFYHIKDKLHETKQHRDAYIEAFIKPIEKMLADAGLKFHIKGRTKSIHSIYQKMKKQNCPFEGVYDLFAIRIILDSPLEREKVECWQTYALITNMYQPNPKRMRDWLSVPKSNGYECLHITVLGPQNKWVEVQIRTERMDEIAEKGLAAHWRYKGVQEDGMDSWLSRIRQAIETKAPPHPSPLGEGDILPSSAGIIHPKGENEGGCPPPPMGGGWEGAFDIFDTFSAGSYEKEVFVFTPKGELKKFPKGATILDFAYSVHSKVGNACIGAKINGKAVPFRYQLQSGDSVEILTSAAQKPKHDWLNIVITGRARSKIRLALKETQNKESQYAKEMLERRLKNRKVGITEQLMSKLLKKLGYKETADFYRDVANEIIDITNVIDTYINIKNHEENADQQPAATVSAENYVFDNEAVNRRITGGGDDVLVIDQHLKGVDYVLSRCCNPIYGDEVFGFVTISSGIKIHRADCPNARDMRERYGYRIVRAVWSGKGAASYDITLRIIGNDDIGILSNITNIISKEEKILVRSVNIDSHDGLFSGHITIAISDQPQLNRLIKRLQQVKGVKQVTRQ